MMDQLCMHFMRHTLTFFSSWKLLHFREFYRAFPFEQLHINQTLVKDSRHTVCLKTVFFFFLLNLLFTSTKRLRKGSDPQVSSLCHSKQSGEQKNLALWGQFDYLALALLPITCSKLATPERDKAHWAAEVECSNYISNSPQKCCSLVHSSSMLQTLHMSLSTLNWLSRLLFMWSTKLS